MRRAGLPPRCLPRPAAGPSLQARRSWTGPRSRNHRRPQLRARRRARHPPCRHRGPLPPGSGETGARADATRVASQASLAALESIVAGQSGSCAPAGPPTTAMAGCSPTPTWSAAAPGGRSRTRCWPGDLPGFPPNRESDGEKHRGSPLRRRTAGEGTLSARSQAWPLGRTVLWNRGAENGGELVAERGHFTVVEGKVLSVRESGSIIYVNFGRRWSETLTVTILKRNERNFTAPASSQKTRKSRVRVRGWSKSVRGRGSRPPARKQIEIAER